MLLLCFSLGDERFALDTGAVREVIPMVGMKKIPKAPEWVAGIMLYHAEPVPVIDLCALNMQKPAARRMSTRIILVDFTDHQGAQHLLGLLAEKATETLQRKPEEFSDTGVRIPDSSWLGGVTSDKEGMIQLIAVEKLLPPGVQELLFQQVPDEER